MREYTHDACGQVSQRPFQQTMPPKAKRSVPQRVQDDRSEIRHRPQETP